jgi:D-alanine-D-alanine ligase
MIMHPMRTDLPALLLYNADAAWTTRERRESQHAAHTLGAALRREGHPVIEVCLDSPDLSSVLAKYDPNDYLIFNWCEELPGVPRSSAMVAQTLEMYGFTYTGANAQALAFSQDKTKVKQQLAENGIPTPRWKIYTDHYSNDWNTFPAIIKPACEHCSVGISRDAVVRTASELSARIAYVIENHNQPALVEEFIDGREFHVTIIGNGTLRVLPPAEMDFSAFKNVEDRLCTYESKFDPQSIPYNAIKLRLPAPLTEIEVSRLEDTVLAAYHAAYCRDYARLDVRLQDGIFYILDVNPNADICPDTSLVLAAEMVGLSYGKLASLLINLASQRHSVFGKSSTDEISIRNSPRTERNI